MVVRYLPGRRCTLRLESAGRPTRYVKVYRDDRGLRADVAGRLLWGAAGRGELAFSVPRPDSWDASTRTLFQYELVGSAVTRRLYGPHGADVAHRIGRAAASLAHSSVEPKRVFDAAAQMAHSIDVVHELARRVPKLVTMEHAKARRAGRVFADSFRNGYTQTIVAPYSVRRRPHAPVSAPLAWDEVSPRLDPARFALRTFDRRLAHGDPWADFWRRRQTLRPPAT